MTNKPTTIRLAGDAPEALRFLRSLPGGYNLSGTISKLILDAAKAKGWKQKADRLPDFLD